MFDHQLRRLNTVEVVDRQPIGGADCRAGRLIDVNQMPISMGFAPMGWAIGASIGGKLANPKFPVLCITGDGSYLMSAQEISVARQLGINVVILVLNNGVLGTVMHGQRMRGLENTANELPRTDFAVED